MTNNTAFRVLVNGLSKSEGEKLLRNKFSFSNKEVEDLVRYIY